MTEVPSTLTALDKTMELRRISDEIAKLKSIKERAEIDYKTIINNTDTAQKRFDTLDNQVNELIKKLIKASEETTEFLTFCQKSIRDSSENFNLILELTKQLTQKAEKAAIDLKATEDKATVIHTDIVRQQEDIERKNRDLSIYHARLKKYFAEHLPDQVIII